MKIIKAFLGNLNHAYHRLGIASTDHLTVLLLAGGSFLKEEKRRRLPRTMLRKRKMKKQKKMVPPTLTSVTLQESEMGQSQIEISLNIINFNREFKVQ